MTDNLQTQANDRVEQLKKQPLSFFIDGDNKILLDAIIKKDTGNNNLSEFDSICNQYHQHIKAAVNTQLPGYVVTRTNTYNKLFGWTYSYESVYRHMCTFQLQRRKWYSL